MTARALAVVVLFALPLLAGSQSDVECQPGGPELIVTGTVSAVDGEPPALRIHLDLDAVEAGSLVASGEPADARELTFVAAAGRSHPVGAHVRVELQRYRPLTGEGVASGDLVEYRCYLGAPPRPPGPPHHTGCAGCAGGGTAGVVPVLAAIAAGFRRRKR